MYLRFFSWINQATARKSISSSRGLSRWGVGLRSYRVLSGRRVFGGGGGGGDGARGGVRNVFGLNLSLRRWYSVPVVEEVQAKGRNLGYKAIALMFVVASVAVLMIPIYKLYCACYGGQVAVVEAESTIPLKQKLLPVSERRELVTVQFTSNAHHSMPVKFVPCQTEMTVLVGEPALAFFACYNTTNETLHGMATYTIYPSSAHYYFSKLQCFCFEEQRIKPHEYIELPVFFYVDPDFSLDPNTGNADFMILSYTFFSVDAKP